MMDVKLPNLGEGADSGTVVSVLVSEGDQIVVDQPIVELESEKAVATIPSSAAGTVEKIHVQNGQTISAGARILTLSGGPSVAEKTEAPVQTAAPVPQVATAYAPDVSGVSLEAIPDSVPMPVAPPSVRFLAAQLGLDLRRVAALTGGSKVSAVELKQYVETLQKLATTRSQAGSAKTTASSPAPESIDFSQWGEVVRKPMSQLRKVIARRMSENWNAIPHVTQFDEVDMTNILALRKKFIGDYDARGARLTVTPFILKAVVNALKQHPVFNSSLDEIAGEVVLKEYFHLGLAVDTDAGLLVPVIRDVDKKSILDLSKEIAEVAGKARDRKVSPDDMRGGTFTISNQGAFGGGHFTPIVNRPEVAILGLGRSSDKPVVRDGVIEVRPMMPIALSYDHRVIDGGAAARFTVDLVAAFEKFDTDDVRLCDESKQ